MIFFLSRESPAVDGCMLEHASMVWRFGHMVRYVLYC